MRKLYILYIASIVYRGWENCLKLTNGIIELILTTDVGPRIISYGFCGDRNEFCVWDEQAGLTGGNEWRCYGGSRLWHGPEIGTRCYEPDNTSVNWEETDNGIILRQDIEPWTQIHKEIHIKLESGSTRARFDYKVTNESPWDAKLCIWVLTLMDANGMCIIPVPDPKIGMAPNGVLPIGAIAFWPYTSFADSRFNIGEKYYTLKHNPLITQNFKMGMPVFEGWVAYVNNNHMFVKYFEHKNNSEYPDYCSSFELYCCQRFTEVETLSPMAVLKTGEFLKHWEEWELHNAVKLPRNEDEIDLIIRPLIGKNK